MKQSKTKKRRRRAPRALAKLQRTGVRRSAPKSKKQAAQLHHRLLLKDAFAFLENLDPGSVDLIISSPPYCMGKEYETSLNLDDFVAAHEKLAPLLARALRRGGSLCWQIGHHVQQGVVTPLDTIVYPIFAQQKGLLLRNRIIWTFGHGVHAMQAI